MFLAKYERVNACLATLLPCITRCFWLGLNDRDEEGGFTWASGLTPSFMPPFGPFEVRVTYSVITCRPLV